LNVCWDISEEQHTPNPKTVPSTSSVDISVLQQNNNNRNILQSYILIELGVWLLEITRELKKGRQPGLQMR